MKLFTELGDRAAEQLSGGDKPLPTGGGLITGLFASEEKVSEDALEWHNPNKPPNDGWGWGGNGNLPDEPPAI